ncbi:MAG: gliding motility-associated C-terminal domain-containing protein, partial [Cytophagales bacterium]
IVSTATGTPNTISGYKYNWSPATGLNNTTISSPLANAISTAGINYTVTATDFRNCIARDFVNIKKTSLEMAFVSPIASVVSVCSGEIVTNLQISRKGGVAPFIFTWSPLGILTKNTDSLYNTKAITSNQKILVSIADASRCTDKDSVSIVLKPLPTLQVKNDSVVNICTGNTKEIKVLLDTEASENNISWTPNTISTYKPTFTAATEAKEEIFTFTVVSNISGCSSASNIKIGTKISTPISIAGPEGTLKINENYDFNANESGLQYAWQIRSVSGVSDFTPAISNLQKLSQTFDSPGGYTISLTGTNADGCVSGASLNIQVKSKIIKFYVPTVFSPASADEKNKTFKVFYNNVDNDIDKSQFRITIFNTLGNKVFESDNFDEMSSTGWAGEGFATGVYTWIVQYKVQGSEPEKIYNTVTLLK